MLNEKQERELAYVVKVDNISSIAGRDRVECAHVGGWTCMVPKGAFQVGSLGIYFEIDSKVDETKPEFAFTAKYHGKIKTQKFKTPEGPFFSQGLLMAPADFGWSEADIKEGDYLTQKLGVTYAVEEDNQRKAKSDPNAKYKSMMSRHPQLAKSSFGKWCMKHVWAKKLLYLVLGKKKKDTPKGWPVGRFPGVSKTDQERCLPGGTKILTDQGWIQINKIVNHTLPVKVASMNSDGSISYKEIIDYQKFRNSKEMKTIRYPYAPYCERTNALCCTLDHRIFTQRGYVEAKDLTLEDKVYMPVETYSEEVLPIIYGMLLGDSYIANDRRSNGMLRVVATNGEKQYEYLKYKASIFNNDGKIVNAGLGTFGSVPSYHWFINTDAQISVNVRKDWYKENVKKVTKEVCDKLTAASLAFWYMDDGCLSYRNDTKTAYFICLNTQGFSLEENQLLVDTLSNKFNITANINRDKIAADGHQMYRITIGVKEECNKFFDLIAPYVCDSMLYKLPKNYQNRTLKTLFFTKKQIAFPLPILSIEDGQTKNNTWAKHFNIVYDLEIEDTHNFVADNIIVHNCENMTWILNDKTPFIVTQKCDGSSGTYILEKKGKNKFEFYVCSRNVRMKDEEQECFYGSHNYYWEVAKKYDIENKMRAWLNDNSERNWVCWQGEICAPGIQKNPHNLSETHFYCFHWTDNVNGRRDIRDAVSDWKNYEMETVPIVCDNYIMPDDFEEFKKTADGYYDMPVCENHTDCKREGFVYYKTTEPTFSFKNVSREYLIKNREKERA